MKPEEALEILELPKDPLKSGTHYHAMPSSKRISCTDYLNARRVAIESLKKQVPKKPIESEFTPLICPDCEAKIILGQRYCENCGQRIDWSDPKHD